MEVSGAIVCLGRPSFSRVELNWKSDMMISWCFPLPCVIQPDGFHRWCVSQQDGSHICKL
jgi:hypothetical protein